MRSVNYPLRKAYKTALNTISYGGNPVPSYYLAAPQEEDSKYYITFNGITNIDVSTRSSSDTDSSVQVQIHTWDNGTNAGKVADDIADLVFEVIYPKTQAVLDMSADNFQMVSTKLTGDITRELAGHGNRVFVTRIITFQHNIFHK